MSKKKLVLLIEDEAALVKILQESLSERGLAVDVAIQGEEGWQKTKELRPDLVLLDVVVPRLDGFIYLKRLRHHKKLQHTPVIILSNLGQDTDMAEARALGVVDYLVKSNHTIEAIVNRAIAVLAETKSSTDER